MSTIPERMHSAMIRQSIDLARYEAGLRARVLKLLNRLGSDLVTELSDAGLDTPRTDWQQARLRNLLKVAEQRASEVYGEVDALTRDEYRGLVEIMGDKIVTRLNAAMGAEIMAPINWTTEQIAAIADDTLVFGAKIGGSGGWWARQKVDLQQAFGDQMRMGLLRGESLGQLVQRVKGAEGFLGIATRNAEALVTSSAISLANEAHLAAYDANSDIMHGIEWIATLDKKTCSRCGKLDGLEWDEKREPIGHDTPFPGPVVHWRCLVGDTKVESPGILRGFERSYSGDVVIIRTAAGNELTCTPNHPILTDAGWIAAGLLKKGQKVVRRLPGDGFILPAPNAVKVESRIHDVVTSFLGSCGMVPVSVPLTPKDFHGDTLDHEVATVWSDGKLWDGMDAPAPEYICELCLESGGPSRDMGLPGLCRQNHSLEAGRLPPVIGRNPRRVSVPPGLGHLLPADEHGLTLIAGSDAAINEPACDDGPGYSQALCNRLDAISTLIGGDDFMDRHGGFEGLAKDDASVDEIVLEDPMGLSAFIRETVERFSTLVAFDEVLEIRDHSGFRGHVYNLETEGNWYVAANILTHNCRCSQLPKTKSWEELAIKNKALARELDRVPVGQRASMGGPVPADLTYEGWFKGLDADDQKDILGQGRYDLWRAGKIDLRGLTNQSGNVLTLDELRAR